MNEKSKVYMSKQRSDIYQTLKTFGLSVYEDEVAADEEEEILKLDAYNFFTIAFGDIKKVDNSKKQISQIVAIDYYSENRDDVDEMTIDIITIIEAVKGISFTGTQRDRLQVKDLDRYVDRVTLLFRRAIPLGCSMV